MSKCVNVKCHGYDKESANGCRHQIFNIHDCSDAIVEKSEPKQFTPDSIIRRLDGVVKAYESEVKIAEECKKEWKGKNINAYNLSEQRRYIFSSVISTLKEIMTNV